MITASDRTWQCLAAPNLLPESDSGDVGGSPRASVEGRIIRLPVADLPEVSRRLRLHSYRG